MMIRYCILIVFSIFSLYSAKAVTHRADSTDYLNYLSQLLPGDTLLLTSGTYTRTLPLVDIHGEKGKYIVIIGGGNHSTVFEGKSGRNTVSITKCSYLIIKNLKIDGLGQYADGVKAEGTDGNYAHHIILDNLLIVNHQKNLQFVAISTKCPAWDWIIRNNTIDLAGTGIYLGNSDGTKPFVNGIIEYNLIKNTRGYNMEIKHQNEGLRNIPGMTKNGKTIIRYNVFSRYPEANIELSKRPNLLVGNFPSNGDGKDDVYEIYGNFFYQNPNEALFQGTGNIALYSNVFINNFDPEGFRAVYITKHKNFKPRSISIFHNTVWTKNSSGGIRIFAADSEYEQYVWANAVFSANPITNVKNIFENVTDSYENAYNYLTNASESISELDVFPKNGNLFAEAVDMSLFDTFTDYDLDFNREKFNTAFRGAYSGMGNNPGWKLQLEKRPRSDNPVNVNDISIGTKIYIAPNPAGDYIEISTSAVTLNEVKYPVIKIYDVLGVCVLTLPCHSCESRNLGKREEISNQVGNDSTLLRIDVSGLPAGVYFVRVGDKILKFVKM